MKVKVLRRTLRRTSFYLIASVAFMLIMLILFTTLYHLVEEESWLDAFYFTVITTRTIGFGDITPETQAGKIITIFNALVPATIFLGASLVVLETFFEALEKYWRTWQMRKHHDHTIIVTDEDLMPSIIEEYRTEQDDFVIVHPKKRLELKDPLADLIDESEYLQADATNDSALERAQIMQARRILIATANDTTNLFVLVSAKGLNPDIIAIVRINNEQTGAKFEAVGADYLLPASNILGRMLSQASANPISHHFLVRLHTHTRDPFISELTVPSEEAGKPVLEAYPRAIALYRQDEYLYNIDNQRLQSGDIVLSISLKFS